MAVVIETTLGDLTVDLFVEQRPQACLNFLKLCKMKYYNFSLFHSVQSGFLAQAGDPTGSGSGGESIWGVLEGKVKRYFTAERVPKIRHSDAGMLSMVCAGDSLVGSQFFFTLGADLDSLDTVHCVIGIVTEGHDVLRQLNEVICDETHRPYRDVRVTHTVILEDPFDDPPGFHAPDRSPSPSAERLAGGRIAPDEEIDETEGKTIEEINELIEEKEAKARATILEIVGDLPDADVAPPENVLFVCKLNPVTTDSDLEIIFSRFGKIENCEVIRDKKSGDSLQYAFIEFEDQKSCENAYFKMDNVLIDDRRIHVDFSQSVSKIKWLGKGRGVKHVDEKVPETKNSAEKPARNRSRSRDKNDRQRRRSNSRNREDRPRRRSRSRGKDDRSRRRSRSRDRNRRSQRDREDRKRDRDEERGHRRNKKSKSRSPIANKALLNKEIKSSTDSQDSSRNYDRHERRRRSIDKMRLESTPSTKDKESSLLSRKNRHLSEDHDTIISQNKSSEINTFINNSKIGSLELKTSQKSIHDNPEIENKKIKDSSEWTRKEEGQVFSKHSTNVSGSSKQNKKIDHLRQERSDPEKQDRPISSPKKHLKDETAKEQSINQSLKQLRTFTEPFGSTRDGRKSSTQSQESGPSATDGHDENSENDIVERCKKHKQSVDFLQKEINPLPSRRERESADGYKRDAALLISSPMGMPGETCNDDKNYLDFSIKEKESRRMFQEYKSGDDTKFSDRYKNKKEGLEASKGLVNSSFSTKEGESVSNIKGEDSRRETHYSSKQRSQKSSLDVSNKVIDEKSASKPFHNSNRDDGPLSPRDKRCVIERGEKNIIHQNRKQTNFSDSPQFEVGLRDKEKREKVSFGRSNQEPRLLEPTIKDVRAVSTKEGNRLPETLDKQKELDQLKGGKEPRRERSTRSDHSRIRSEFFHDSREETMTENRKSKPHEPRREEHLRTPQNEKESFDLSRRGRGRVEPFRRETEYIDNAPEESVMISDHHSQFRKIPRKDRKSSDAPGGPLENSRRGFEYLEDPKLNNRSSEPSQRDFEYYKNQNIEMGHSKRELKYTENTRGEKVPFPRSRWDSEYIEDSREEIIPSEHSRRDSEYLENTRVDRVPFPHSRWDTEYPEPSIEERECLEQPVRHSEYLQRAREGRITAEHSREHFQFMDNPRGEREPIERLDLEYFEDSREGRRMEHSRPDLEYLENPRRERVPTDYPRRDLSYENFRGERVPVEHPRRDLEYLEDSRHSIVPPNQTFRNVEHFESPREGITFSEQERIEKEIFEHPRRHRERSDPSRPERLLSEYPKREIDYCENSRHDDITFSDQGRNKKDLMAHPSRQTEPDHYSKGRNAQERSRIEVDYIENSTNDEPAFTEHRKNKVHSDRFRREKGSSEQNKTESESFANRRVKEIIDQDDNQSLLQSSRRLKEQYERSKVESMDRFKGHVDVQGKYKKDVLVGTSIGKHQAVEVISKNTDKRSVEIGKDPNRRVGNSRDASINMQPPKTSRTDSSDPNSNGSIRPNVLQKKRPFSQSKDAPKDNSTKVNEIPSIKLDKKSKEIPNKNASQAEPTAKKKKISQKEPKDSKTVSKVKQKPETKKKKLNASKNKRKKSSSSSSSDSSDISSSSSSDSSSSESDRKKKAAKAKRRKRKMSTSSSSSSEASSSSSSDTDTSSESTSSSSSSDSGNSNKRQKKKIARDKKKKTLKKSKNKA